MNKIVLITAATAMVALTAFTGAADARMRSGTFVGPRGGVTVGPAQLCRGHLHRLENRDRAAGTHAHLGRHAHLFRRQELATQLHRPRRQYLDAPGLELLCGRPMRLWRDSHRAARQYRDLQRHGHPRPVSDLTAAQ